MTDTLSDKMLCAFAENARLNDPLLVGYPDAPTAEFLGLKGVPPRLAVEKMRGDQ